MRTLLLFAVAACSKTDDKKPAGADPWATGGSASAGVDPWASGSAAPVEPNQAQPAPPPSGDTSTLAGSYQCFVLRYGTLVNGMHQSAYVASALGAFEIDANGTYRSASYADKGNGRTHAESASVTFEGGPYAGFIGEVGRNSSGAYIRFGEKTSEVPTPNMRFNDHICNRK